MGLGSVSGIPGGSLLEDIESLKDAVAQCGPHLFEVDSDGHLIMYYSDPLDPSIYSINEAGHLILTMTT
jgi:hypothetical protein